MLGVSPVNPQVVWWDGSKTLATPGPLLANPKAEPMNGNTTRPYQMFKTFARLGFLKTPAQEHFKKAEQHWILRTHQVRLSSAYWSSNDKLARHYNLSVSKYFICFLTYYPTKYTGEAIKYLSYRVLNLIFKVIQRVRSRHHLPVGQSENNVHLLLYLLRDARITYSNIHKENKEQNEPSFEKMFKIQCSLTLPIT